MVERKMEFHDDRCCRDQFSQFNGRKLIPLPVQSSVSLLFPLLLSEYWSTSSRAWVSHFCPFDDIGPWKCHTKWAISQICLRIPMSKEFCFRKIGCKFLLLMDIVMFFLIQAYQLHRLQYWWHNMTVEMPNMVTIQTCNMGWQLWQKVIDCS